MIDSLLPQTQCTRCGYAGCLPYAQAIVDGVAEINQCPPGGAATIEKLAALTARAPLPLNPANGVESPPLVAYIDEARCIGCTRCLPPCPTDAIVGTSRSMHTVIAELCTGCELCLPPCPVDCIAMVPRASVAGISASLPPADASRARFIAHNERAARRSNERAARLAEKKRAAHGGGSP